MGGNACALYIFPGVWNHNIWDSNHKLKKDYPIHKHIHHLLQDDQEPDKITPGAFGTWPKMVHGNPGAPKYVGQPFAHVSGVHYFFQETGYPFPVFVKRSLTSAGRKT